MDRHTLLATLEVHRFSSAVPADVGSRDPESVPGNRSVIADYRGTFLAPGGIEAQQAPNKNVADPYGSTLVGEEVMAVVDLTELAIELVIDGDYSAVAVAKDLVGYMDPRTALALGI